MVRNDLRNVAIIAHVDHGKTTLVDALLRQSGAFRDNQAVAERVMDSGDIERERGITILAKNCSCTYKGVKINIVDTPGHADFGGEVERVLKMVNGVLLLVDAAEGCMPQTRFVLQKALQQNLSLVVAINKIDRPDARIKEVIDEVLYLLMDLGATDEQLECPMLFCCGRDGTASLDPDVPGTDLIPLFDTLLSTIQPPEGDPEAPFQMLVSSVDYNEFVGRIGIGRIQNGVARVGEEVQVCDWHNPDLKMRGRLTKLYDFQANGRQPCDNITAGDIVAFSGLPDVTIGNTLCSPSQVEPLPFVKINDPTVEMTFSVNDSPLAGREGKFVTSRQIRDRLQKELLKDVALKVEDSATTDSFRVMGRGEMHLSILIETMRREGYELQVSPPHVLTKVIDGKTYEPMEHVVIDVPTQYQGAVMTGLGQRKALLQQIESLGTDRVRLEFRMPSRGLFGYRNQFLTDTHGEGILNQIFDGYDIWAGMIANRSTGSLVSFETGEAVTYGLFNAQERGTLFIGPGVPVYGGMVIGVSPRSEDITVNICKKKQLTNMRASGSDEALRLVPPKQMSLEQCLEFLADDELLEVTPKSLRMRKAILDHEKRMKALHGKKNHCNRFEAEYDWRFVHMTRELIPACMDMLSVWSEDNAARLDPSIAYEHDAIIRAFAAFEQLGLEGGVLYANGEIMGFTMGEFASRDTFDVHFEKARVDINGAYPMVCRELTRMLMAKHPNLKYMNREDDMGLESLRTSKLSYKPEYLLKKYTARWLDE